ncbi:MAG: hypothetical protein MK102_11475 [Fuerstiella sp.]|nr:hypothetical protein [Fuerstiella sp.]
MKNAIKLHRQAVVVVLVAALLVASGTFHRQGSFELVGDLREEIPWL